MIMEVRLSDTGELLGTADLDEPKEMHRVFLRRQKAPTAVRAAKLQAETRVDQFVVRFHEGKWGTEQNRLYKWWIACVEKKDDALDLPNFSPINVSVPTYAGSVQP